MREDNPFSLLETMRWENGVALLGRHLNRLERSARELDFTFEREAVKKMMAEYANLLESDAIYKLRMTLARNGGANVVCNKLDTSVPAFHKAIVDLGHTYTADPLRQHKTTCREFYERLYKAAREREYDEAIFLNEDGEVVEGTRTNVWAQSDGIWKTPPCSSGALPGVFREYLLEDEADRVESTLTVDDLRAADAVQLSNAVHGLTPVEIDYGNLDVNHYFTGLHFS